MAIHLSQILFYAGGRSLELSGPPSRRTTTIARRGEDIIETFSRASTGSYIDRNGEIKLAESGLQRIDMVDLDGDGIRETPAFLLEDTRTNVLLRAQEIDNGAYTNIGTPIVTANDAVAPDGTTTADEIDDNDGAVAEARQQAITIADDSTTWVGSVFVRKAPTGSPVVALHVGLTGGTARTGIVLLDPITGSVLAGGAEEIKVAVIEHGNAWRIWTSVANNSTGNTSLEYRLYPAARATGDLATGLQSAPTGTNHFWGGDVENAAFPSSYIATVGSTVARAAESLNFPYHAQPQASTVYVRFVERGTIDLTGSRRIFEIGTDGSNPRLLCYPASSVYNFEHITTGGSVIANDLAVTPSIGDTVELVCQLSATGTALIIQSINGAASTQSAETAALALGTSWSGSTLHINSGSAGSRGFNAFVDVFVASGVHSLADCRQATQQ